MSQKRSVVTPSHQKKIAKRQSLIAFKRRALSRLVFDDGPDMIETAMACYLATLLIAAGGITAGLSSELEDLEFTRKVLQHHKAIKAKASGTSAEKRRRSPRSAMDFDDEAIGELRTRYGFVPMVEKARSFNSLGAASPTRHGSDGNLAAFDR
jgi:hypothetical protein